MRRPQWIPNRPDLPGIGLAALLGLVAFGIGRALPPSPYFSDILLAMVLGALVLNTPLRKLVGLELPAAEREPDRYASGLRFTGKWILRAGIIANAKKAAKSFEVTEEGSAVVNGVQVQTLKAKVRMQGIDVTFYWYYWSGPKGTVQLYGYASPADFDANFKAIQDLMNGLTL